MSLERDKFGFYFNVFSAMMWVVVLCSAFILMVVNMIWGGAWFPYVVLFGCFTVLLVVTILWFRRAIAKEKRDQEKQLKERIIQNPFLVNLLQEDKIDLSDPSLKLEDIEELLSKRVWDLEGDPRLIESGEDLIYCRECLWEGRRGELEEFGGEYVCPECNGQNTLLN